MTHECCMIYSEIKITIVLDLSYALDASVVEILVTDPGIVIVET